MLSFRPTEVHNAETTIVTTRSTIPLNLSRKMSPLNDQNDPWDSRPSGDYLGGRKNSSYKHVRQESSMSASDVYNQPYQEPKDSFSTASLNYDYANQYSQNAQNPAYPSYAHTQNALPTPTNNYYDAPADSHVERPLQAQPTPW